MQVAQLALRVGAAGADQVGHGVALGSLGHGEAHRGAAAEVGPGPRVAGQHHPRLDLLVEGPVDLRGEVAASQPLLRLLEREGDHRRDRRAGAGPGQEEPRTGRRHDGESEDRPRPPAAGPATGRGGGRRRHGYDGRAPVPAAGAPPGHAAGRAAGSGHRDGGREDRGGGRRAGPHVELGGAQGLPGAPELDQEGVGIDRTSVGVAVSGQGHEPVQGGRHRGDPARGRGHGAVDVLVGHVDGGVAAERLGAREHLEQQQPRSVDVAPGVGDAALDLLGGEVGHRAQEHPRLRGGRGAGDRAGQPEVGDLDHAVLAQDDVLRLDVAVDQAGAVRGAQRLQHRVEDVQRGAGGQRALGLHDLTQRVPVDQLHGEEHAALVVALVVDRDDVGVAQPGGRARFAPEPADEGLVGGQARAHHLQCHLAVEPLVQGHVDRGHAAVGDVRQDAVPAVEHLADEGRGTAGDTPTSLERWSGGPGEAVPRPRPVLAATSAP